MNNDEKSRILSDLSKYLSHGIGLEDNSAVAMPVAAMNALLGVVERTTSHTMMGLQNELKEASRIMLEWNTKDGSRSNISLQSGCDLFLRYSTRTFLELDDFDACRTAILERGQRFTGISMAARDRIASVGQPFIGEGQIVLTHGWSRVVAALLRRAASKTHFSIYILEGRPDAAGAKAAAWYSQKTGIPTKIVLDAAVGYVMDKVDLVLIGAEGVVENGGIVNKLGTYALALCARSHDKPVYVAAESYKFARLYPLSQQDLPSNNNTNTRNKTVSLTFVDDIQGEKVDVPASVEVDYPLWDYTPPKFITLLFTDLGVLTPSAVSDELIRLYQ
jgi:translation initiation factor eIF-2B subunit alpha